MAEKCVSRTPLWLGAGVALLVVACAAIDGERTVLIADGIDGRSETSYVLMPPSGNPAAVERSGALLAGTAQPARSFAFILLDTGGGVNLSTAQAAQQLFDASYFAANRGSIRRFYQEASYGLQDITGSVVGPLPFSPASSCDPMGALALRAQVDAMLPAPVTNYLWYFGSRQSGCAWEGLATLGSPAHPTRDTWYNASNGCVVLAQEPGHNFGMQHSSSMKCTGRTFVDMPDGTCTHVEYGDPFDPMGGGCRHPNAWQKRYQGWLGGCNSVRLSASGTFTLFPLETACNGIQVLQIPMPHPRTFSYTGGLTPGTTTDELTYYYVEMRSEAAGFDQGLAPQVQIRIGGDYRGPSENGLHTWLLDMNPGTSTFSDAALAVGQTFTDPAGGVGITATAVTASSATVAVTIEGGAGDPTCLDGTTVAPPGPPTCAGTGAGGSGGAVGSTGSGGGAGGPGPAGATGAGGAAGTAGVAGTPGLAGAAGADAPDAATGSADAGGAEASGGGGCGCGVARPNGRWPSGAGLILASLVLMRARRRRCGRAARSIPGGAAAACTLLGIASLIACARSETVTGGQGGASAGAGGASSGGTGALAGASGAVGGRGGAPLGGAGGRGGAAGAGGATGAGGSAGVGGAAGRGGSTPATDAGTGAAWSCAEYPGALCFCDRSDGGGASACSSSWTCCLAGATSCECYDDDPSSCQSTAASGALSQVPACPP